MAALIKALENNAVVDVILGSPVGVERTSPVTFSTDLNPQQQICNHESDGMIYTSNPPQNKCKKCGVYFI